MQADIDTAYASLQRARQSEAAAQTAVDSWVHSQSTAPVAPQRAGRRNATTRPDYATLAGRSAAALPSNDQLNAALDSAKLRVLDKGKVHQAAIKKLADFQAEHYTAYDEFVDLGMEVARPIAEEYKRLFIHPNGDYYNIVKAYMAARVLNPLVAADMSQEEMVDALRDLTAFGFDELRSAVIQDLIDEIPKYRAAINSTSDSFWSNVEGAAKYDDDLRRKKEEDPDKYADHTWQSDRIEQARRVWEWWRAKRAKFAYFYTAARLVAIVPISSASVERVFSQVKFIIESVGESVLEETLETRVMERINKYRSPA